MCIVDRQERMKCAGFSLFVGGSRGVRVLPDGTGLTNVWRQQIQQFKNVSVEVANAIIAVYPSPRSLYDVSSYILFTDTITHFMFSVQLQRPQPNSVNFSKFIELQYFIVE